MTSKRAALRFTAGFLALGGLTLAGVFAYVTPNLKAESARAEGRPSFADDAPARILYRDLPQGAVDAGGIEKDLDGNASALQVP
jgi:hypothetical protein